MSRPITVVDLFCGAGGLGAGLHAAGLETIHAVDSLPAAVRTYDMNFAKPARLESLRWDAELPSADVIVGGPPCQGFSSAGQRRLEDSRNSLVAVFAQLVACHRPSAFVFENVEGFLTGDDGRYLLEFLDTLVCAGYCMHLRKVNAAHYGVPQHRKRVIVVGGLGWDPGFPGFTHCAAGMPGAARVGRGLPPCPTVGEALRGLPAAEKRLPTKGPSSDHSFRAPGRRRLGALSCSGPGPDHEGPAGGVVASDVSTPRIPPGDGWDAFRAPRRCASGSAQIAWRPALESDHQRCGHRVRSPRGAQAPYVARVRPAADLPGRFPVRRYASRKSAAHRQRRAALAWRSAGPAPQASVARERRVQDASVAGPQVFCSNAWDGDEPGPAPLDLGRRSPLLGDRADVAPRVGRPSPVPLSQSQRVVLRESGCGSRQQAYHPRSVHKHSVGGRS